MKLYDISQEVFSCAVYPGDPKPERQVLSSVDAGSVCNLTAFSMCAHNGTHIDAPFHFLHHGKSVEQIVTDGMQTKISQMTEDCQSKLQDTLQKIINDSNGGMICIII